tara:strand:- start:31610 stop:31990 length:381 start_codon:yes stop_codon:yes gene_type:complete
LTNPLLTKVFTATGVAIAGYLIVAAAAGGKVELANAANDLLLGATDSMGCPAGGQLDIAQAGWSEVRCGGNVSFGDPLTSDANGKAIKAVPVVGQMVRVIGFAQADAVADDIIPYQVAPCVLATPA